MSDALTRHARRALAVVALGLLAAGSFGVAMTRENPNENMYVAAGVLLHRGQALYSDFAYLQTPLLPHVYQGAFALTGPEHPLLKAKLLTWVFWLAGAGLLFAVLRRLTGETALALALSAVFASNFHVVRTLWEASNYVLATTLSLASLAALLRAVESRPMAWLFTSGALAGLAVATKLTHAAALLPLLLAAGLVRRERPLRGLLAMGAGVALGSLPIVVYLLADPEIFWFDNLRFHQLVTEWYRLFGYTRAMDAASKASWIATEVLARPSTLALLALGLAAALTGSRRPRTARFALGLGLGLFAVTALVACLPTPSWPQYFAMPVPYLLVAVAASGAAARRPRAALALCLICVAVSLPGSGLVDGLLRGSRGESWVAARYRAQALWVAEQLGPGPHGPVATLQPLRVIEAGLPIYPEFATGPFLFAVGHALTPEERRRFVAPSRNALHETFAASPPAALLLGLYGAAWGEDRLGAWAERHGYRPVAPPPGQDGTLYLPPPGP